ncbi:MAG: Rpn family recombination-promoting nuclease/putative transposase [Leptolyngbyaceae cyanobacterium CSU_1_3]|nr:Rpn family recombination-promoting nuclease/putative transposase [Leptolyngbyaceae cyanobacterium CSU_1_3]
MVFPIVLYNGENTWNAPLEIADLIEKVPAIGEYGLHFKYLLLDENTYSKEMLLQIRNIVSTLFLAEAHYDIDLLAQELVNLYQREQDKPAVSLLLNWFRQLAEHGRVSPEDYAQLDYVYRSEEEVRTMLAATLERERKISMTKAKLMGLSKDK